MSKKNISQEKIIQAFISCAFEKSAGATSLSDISDVLTIKKASLYNHFEGRDAIYEASLDFCKKELSTISFLSDRTLDSIKSSKTNVINLFKKLIGRYFNIFEAEPLFQIYTFIHSEQYFNAKALETVQMENQKLSEEIKKILNGFIDTDRFANKNDKELKDISSGIASIIQNLLDAYLAQRKETVRQNPESGVGSLFALPTDTQLLDKAVKITEGYIRNFLI